MDYGDLAGSVGSTEILGTQILGDPAQAVPTKADEDFVRYTETGYYAADRTYLGVGQGPQVIAAGATAVLAVTPSTPFKIQRITMPSAAVPGLFVSNARVGPTELIDGTPIPAEVFSEVSQNNCVSWPTAETSQPISFTVTNTTAAPVSLGIAAFGTRLRK